MASLHQFAAVSSGSKTPPALLTAQTAEAADTHVAAGQVSQQQHHHCHHHSHRQSESNELGKHRQIATGEESTRGASAHATGAAAAAPLLFSSAPVSPQDSCNCSRSSSARSRHTESDTGDGYRSSDEASSSYTSSAIIAPGCAAAGTPTTAAAPAVVVGGNGSEMNEAEGANGGGGKRHHHHRHEHTHPQQQHSRRQHTRIRPCHACVAPLEHHVQLLRNASSSADIATETNSSVMRGGEDSDASKLRAVNNNNNNNNISNSSSNNQSKGVSTYADECAGPLPPGCYGSPTTTIMTATLTGTNAVLVSACGAVAAAVPSASLTPPRAAAQERSNSDDAHNNNNNSSNGKSTEGSPAHRWPSRAPLLSSSSAAVGGHHLALTQGRTFMKKSDSRREERFYESIRPAQERRVAAAVRAARRVVAEAATRERFPIELDSAADSSGDDALSDGKAPSVNEEEEEEAMMMRGGRDGGGGVGGEQPTPRAAASPACRQQDKDKDKDKEEETARRRGEARWRAFRARELASLRLCSGVERAAGGPGSARGPAQPEECGDDAECCSQLSDAELAVAEEAAALWWMVKPPAHNHINNTAAAAAAAPVQAQAQAGGGKESAAARELLAPFVPRFYGLRSLTPEELAGVLQPGGGGGGAGHKDGAAAAAPGITDADTPDAGDFPGGADMIVLEDVCHGFARPCVLDIKMGSRQYGLNASDKKRRSKEGKAAATTTMRYGMRLAGYKRWDAREGGDGSVGAYTTRTKRECRALDLAATHAELLRFLGGRRRLQRVVYEQLLALREAFGRQTALRFYTSSLLIVYDHAAPVATARVVMVDFAYTYERAELREGGDADAAFDYDIGYLKGIDTLLSLLA